MEVGALLNDAFKEYEVFSNILPLYMYVFQVLT